MGEKVGVIKVRLFRPFSVDHLVAALPTSVKKIAVLDRTKELGSVGEPLYLDVVGALFQAKQSGLRPAAADPVVVGGRYGLSSKEFNGSMVKAVFDELKKDKPKANFTVGIIDDVTGLSLTPDLSFNAELEGVKRAVFFGLGSDGTVGANKNSIKIIAENTDNYAQGYFVYDSKKAGAMTISHLRFSPQPMQSPYLIEQAQFVACHQFLVRREARHAEVRGAGRHVPAEHALRQGRDLGPRAPFGAGSADRQETQVLRHQRRQGGFRDRHGPSHQHRDADVLLRHLGRAAARRSDHADQEVHQQDLRH